MAVVATKSTPLTNADATPAVINASRVDRARGLRSVGVVAAVSADSIASVYRFCRVRSSDRVSSIMLSCTAITTCAADVGLYQTAKAGGAVFDADFFASAQSLAAVLSNADITHEAAVYTVAMREMPLWQAMGLTTDPMIDYDIAATLTAAAGSAGTIAIEATVCPGP